jgi:methionyl-tRNA formyltransferase
MSAKNYVVANSGSWLKPGLAEYVVEDALFHYIDSPEKLTVDFLESISPRYVFFPHWNWRIPDAIVSRWECVVFHTAPLPYGRGGSPIQNLILRGFQQAPVNALRATADLDAGPIYLSDDVELSGSLSEIFERIGGAVTRIIVQMIQVEPQPKEQTGIPTVFTRRSPMESEINDEDSLAVIYDKIRMVDYSH